MRYHGGKFRLAPWILGFFPEHRIYVEPYGGAGSVLLRKPRSFAEVYNDLDDEVVNVFRVLRDPKSAAELERIVRLTPWARVEFNGAYEPTDDPIERARRTIVRGFMSYGSTHRRKGRTGFRARPFKRNQTGADDWVNWPPQVRAFVERLQGVTIESAPAVQVIARCDSEETLFYCDPPYPQSTRSSIRCDADIERAYTHDMTDEEHRELAVLLHTVRGFVVLSSYPCPLYEELYGGWEFFERASLADAGVWRTEIVYLNPACARELHRGKRHESLFAQMPMGDTWK